MTVLRSGPIEPLIQTGRSSRSLQLSSPRQSRQTGAAHLSAQQSVSVPATPFEEERGELFFRGGAPSESAIASSGCDGEQQMRLQQQLASHPMHKSNTALGFAQQATHRYPQPHHLSQYGPSTQDGPWGRVDDDHVLIGRYRKRTLL